MDPNDLIGLQQSTKPIRNPFKVDFYCRWNNKPMVLKAKNEFDYLLGPLRDHVARRLWMKIYYQYHDEQRAKIALEQNDKAARKYTVPVPIAHKIWYLITGEDQCPWMRSKNEQQIQQEAADLSELSTTIIKTSQQAAGSVMDVADVSSIIESANAEVEQLGMTLGVGESARSKGSKALKSNEAIANAQANAAIPLDNQQATDFEATAPQVEETPQPAETANLAPEVPTQEQAPEQANEGFAGLAELDK